MCCQSKYFVKKKKVSLNLSSHHVLCWAAMSEVYSWHCQERVQKGPDPQAGLHYTSGVSLYEHLRIHEQGLIVGATHRVHMWASIARAPCGIHERTSIARALLWIHEWPSFTQVPHRIHKQATIAWVSLRSHEWAPLHESLFNPRRDSTNLPPFHKRHSMKPLHEGIAWDHSLKAIHEGITQSHCTKENYKGNPWRDCMKQFMERKSMKHEAHKRARNTMTVSRLHCKYLPSDIKSWILSLGPPWSIHASTSLVKS